MNGAADLVSVVNGRYTLTDEVRNGRPCYKKERDELWLCSDLHSLWSFQPQGHLGSDVGLMVSTEKHAYSPVGAGPWRVWQASRDGQDGIWAAGSATVRDEAPHEEASQAQEELPLETLIARTIAALLFGFAILAIVAGGMFHSWDDNVRAYTYRMVGALMTFTIAMLFSRAVWDFLTLQLLPTPFPWGFGIEPNLHIKVLVSFILFTLCVVLLNVIGWKVQHRRVRLMAIKTLGGHVTAMFGLIAFMHIQQAMTFHVSTVFQGGFIPLSVIRYIFAFLVVVFSWVTFSIYRAAAAAARRDFFASPPSSPWGERSQYETGATQPARSCMGFGATSTAPAEQSSAAWGSFVNEAEDEAAIVVDGFLISQAIMFCRTEQMPSIKGHFVHHSEDTGFWFFGNVILALSIIFVIILAVRAQRGPGGRAGKVLQRSTALAITWMMYRACCWNTRSRFQDNRPLALLVTAIVLSLGIFVALVLIDKVVDYALNRTSSTALQAMSARFSTDVPLSEKVMRGINTCFGLVMAMSWCMNFETGIETVVESSPLLSAHPVPALCLLCLLLSVFLYLPWRSTVLPKSEMREGAFLEEIRFEQKMLEDAENFVP